MMSSLNDMPAQVAERTDATGEGLKAELTALRVQLHEKEAALQEKQIVVKELDQNLQEARSLAMRLAEKPPVPGTLQAEIDHLVGEIESLTVRVGDVEAATPHSKKDIGMADPLLRGFDGELAFLQTQLWVKGVSLELKKNELAKQGKASRVRLEAWEEAKKYGVAGVHKFTHERSTNEANDEEGKLRRGEELDDLWSLLWNKEPLLEALEKEIHALQTEISGFGGRIARMERTNAEARFEAETHAEKSRVSLKTEVSLLNGRIKEREKELRIQQAAVEELEQRLKATIDDLQAQLAEKETRLQASDGELQRLKSETHGLLERIAHLEAAIERGQAEAMAQAERLRDESNAQANSLQAQLLEKEEELASTRGRIAEMVEWLGTKESAVRELEQRSNATVMELRRELAAKTTALDDRDAEIGALRVEVRTLEEQSAEIRRALQETEDAAAKEREKIRAELTVEAATLKSLVTEREAALHEKEIALRDLEEELSAKIRDLELQLSETQALMASRDGYIADLQVGKEELTRQLKQTACEPTKAEEAAAARFEQLRRESLATVAALQARLQEDEEALQKDQIVIGQPVGHNRNDPRGQLPIEPAAREEAEEGLKATINDLQTRLSEKQALVEERDGEIVKLKAQIECLVERGDQMWAAARHAQAEAAKQIDRVKEGLEAEVASLQARLRETEEAHGGRDANDGEVEDRFNLWLQDLQIQLAEKHALLESRNDKIEKLTSEIRKLARPSGQLQSASQPVELEGAGAVEPSGENGRSDNEVLRAVVLEGETVLEKNTAEKKDDDITNGGSKLTPDQQTLEGPNGNGLSLGGDVSARIEAGLPDLVTAGQSLPFSLLNLPPGVERATDLFPLKFMQQYKFFPMKLQDGSLAVAMSDPSDVYTIDAIALQAGSDIKVYAGEERQIGKVLDQHCGPSSSMDRIIQDIEDEDSAAEESEGDIAHLKDLASEAPVIRLVNLLIAKAVENRASDIHIEPFEGSLRVRYRIDGLLVDTESPPPRLQAAIVSRIKLMAKMNIAERRLPQDGRIMMDAGGRQLDLRVSAIPTLYGESVVMRLLDRSSVLLAPDDLGFPPAVRQRFDTLIRRPNGIILVTGPTGSGKTTTLYAALSSINSVEKNIITVEDPVEYQLKGVKQIQVRPRIGLTFATGLRHIVRQDPDVILVGEIRDQETADIAIHAALTGHLVLSTLHTNDAAGAVTRLLDMGIQNYLVSSTLLAVLAQRLVRRICPHCKRPYSPSKETLAEVGIPVAEADQMDFYKGSGCTECNDTGYFGRLGIFELLVVEGDLQRLILEKTDSGTIREKAVEMGMKTLWRDGLEKVVAGVTTLDEVLRVTWEG